MNICFLMYPWENIKPENDTSLALIKECVKRKHGVAICTPANLTIRNSVTNAFCTVVGRMDKVPNSLKTFYNKSKLREEMLPLAGFDVIFMRAEPPLDPIMLNFLDSVKEDVFIINSLEGMREANNKLYTAAFGDSHSNIIPATHVSKNKDYLIQQIKEAKSDKMILKPLNGFGGSGVILIEKSAMSNIKSLLDFY
ncbi:MAG: glutathione synthetase, partial [Aureibaculum sp.]